MTVHPIRSGAARRSRTGRLTPIRTTGFGLGLLAAVAATSGCSHPARLTLPSDAQAVCTVSASDFASWFKSGSVSLDGVVNPADSVNFSNRPNCDFYKWSEHMYLWLTSPAPANYGGGGGRIFASPAFYDVSPRDSSSHRKLIGHTPGTLSAFSLRAAQAGVDLLPVVMSKSGTMFEIVPSRLGPHGNPLILNAQGEPVEIQQIRMGEKQQPLFIDLSGHVIKRPRPIIPKGLHDKNLVAEFRFEGIHLFLDPSGSVVNVEQGQAGGNGVLESQGGSLVYYAIAVNDVYAYFLTGLEDGDIPPPGGDADHPQFPTTQDDLDNITAFASDHGKTFPDPEALAIEVKTSWVDASTLDNPDDYITMKATVPTYDRSDSHDWVRNGQATRTLAMVGIHVVGSTAGHPEMIWATFEHQSNTPDAGYTYVDSSGTEKTVAQDTSGDWLFSPAASTGPFDQEHMFFSDPDIQSVSSFTISPSDTIRWKAWGAASDQGPNPLDSTPAQSNTEVISMNNSVRGQLAAGDVRDNYIMTGATWTIGGRAPTGVFPSGNEVGTSKLANTTLETYQQGSNSLFATGTNCLSCHAGFNPPNATVNVSKIFSDIDPLF